MNTHELCYTFQQKKLFALHVRGGVKSLQIVLPFTGGQKLRAARHTSSETHSLDGRSVRGPPLDAGAKCKTTGGKKSNDMPFRSLSVQDVMDA